MKNITGEKVQMYTISVEDSKFRGVLILLNGTVQCSIGNKREDTGVKSSIDTWDEDVKAMYGNSVWDLRREFINKSISL